MMKKGKNRDDARIIIDTINDDEGSAGYPSFVEIAINQLPPGTRIGAEKSIQKHVDDCERSRRCSSSVNSGTVRKLEGNVSFNTSRQNDFHERLKSNWRAMRSMA